MSDIQLSFDEECRVRALPQEDFKKSEELRDEAHEFVTKTQEFRTLTDKGAALLESKKQTLEQYKLKAIGQRNAVELESEIRRRKAKELEQTIIDRLADLDRLTKERHAILKQEAEQNSTSEEYASN